MDRVVQYMDLHATFRKGSIKESGVVSFTYSSGDPWAVCLGVGRSQEDTNPVIWTFGRELLFQWREHGAAPLAVSDIGDISFRNAPALRASADLPAGLYIALCPDKEPGWTLRGVFTIRVDRAGVLRFLGETEEAVPRGSEHSDVDHWIRELTSPEVE